MATAPHPAKRIYPAHGDAIRVVPLHVPETVHEPTAETLAASPAAVPQLTFRNGPLLSNVEVFTVFWGAAWSTTTPLPVPASCVGATRFSRVAVGGGRVLVATR